MAAAHRCGSFYEDGMLTYIRSLQLKGVYLDVGANVGNHTVYFAQHCPSTQVHSFEPLEICLAHLTENVRLNDLDTVEVHPYGLGAKRRTQTHRIGPDDYQIECRPLDDLHFTEPVAVIKVDIEGMEPEFLTGAVGTLTRDRPVIFAEAGTSPEFRAVIDVLAPLGYQPTGRVFNHTATYEFAWISPATRIRWWLHFNADMPMKRWGRTHLPPATRAWLRRIETRAKRR